MIHPELKTVVQVIIANLEEHIGAIYVSQFSPAPDLEGAVRVLRRVDPDIARVELWRGVQRTEYVKTNTNEWRKAR